MILYIKAYIFALCVLLLHRLVRNNGKKKWNFWYILMIETFLHNWSSAVPQAITYHVTERSVITPFLISQKVGEEGRWNIFTGVSRTDKCCHGIFIGHETNCNDFCDLFSIDVPFFASIFFLFRLYFLAVKCRVPDTPQESPDNKRAIVLLVQPIIYVGDALC